MTSSSAPAVQSAAKDAITLCASITTLDFPSLGSADDDAFQGPRSLTEVKLPILNSIGIGAFCDCVSLQTIDLPNLATAGAAAFQGCTSLANIDFPKLSSVGGMAFGQCTSLISISLPKATSFGDCKDAYKGTYYCTFNPDDCARACTFSDCPNLISVSLAGLQVPTRGQFYGVSSLRKLEVPSLISTATEWLWGVSNLEDLTIGLAPFDDADIRGLASLRFLSLPRLTTTEGSSLSGLGVSAIELATCRTVTDGAFAGDSALVAVNFPTVEQLVGDHQFQGCTSLISVYLTALAVVDPLAGGVFQGCTGLATIGLGAEPPDAFNPDVFVNRGPGAPAMNVRGPASDAMTVYDDSTLIVGDAAGIPISAFIPPSAAESQLSSETPPPSETRSETALQSTPQKSPVATPVDSDFSDVPNSGSVTATIAGVIVAILAVCIVIGYCWWRRKRARETNVQPSSSLLSASGFHNPQFVPPPQQWPVNPAVVIPTLPPPPVSCVGQFAALMISYNSISQSHTHVPMTGDQIDPRAFIADYPKVSVQGGAVPIVMLAFHRKPLFEIVLPGAIAGIRAEAARVAQMQSTSGRAIADGERLIRMLEEGRDGGLERLRDCVISSYTEDTFLFWRANAVLRELGRFAISTDLQSPLWPYIALLQMALVRAPQAQKMSASDQVVYRGGKISRAEVAWLLGQAPATRRTVVRGFTSCSVSEAVAHMFLDRANADANLDRVLWRISVGVQGDHQGHLIDGAGVDIHFQAGQFKGEKEVCLIDGTVLRVESIEVDSTRPFTPGLPGADRPFVRIAASVDTQAMIRCMDCFNRMISDE